jgi:Bacterial archaeo-eukaryotic release factor family 11
VTLHTDIPTRTELEQLLAVRDPLCVSLYVPTSPLTQEAQGGRIELKTLTADAMGQLEAAGAPRRAVTELREPLEELVDDDGFWAEQAHSLAVFAAPGVVRTFRLPNRLTSEVEVGDRFYVKPLLRSVTFPQAAFVLALAAGGVRVVEVAADGPAFVVDVPGLPTDLADSLGAAAERSQSARLIGAEGDKVRLRQFARAVDQALRGLLAGRQLPLILAATEPLDSIYRSLNSYPALAATGIRGNPEALTDDDLAAAARSVLDEVYAAELAAVREGFGIRFHDGRASSDVATVARAATAGAVDTLLVDIDDKVPGVVDEETGAVALADDDAASYGVVDEIARRVLLTGGRVLAVRRDDLPDPTPVAATLRHRL